MFKGIAIFNAIVLGWFLAFAFWFLIMVNPSNGVGVIVCILLAFGNGIQIFTNKIR